MKELRYCINCQTLPQKIDEFCCICHDTSKTETLINFVEDELYCYLPEVIQEKWDDFKKEVLHAN